MYLFFRRRVLQLLAGMTFFSLFVSPLGSRRQNADFPGFVRRLTREEEEERKENKVRDQARAEETERRYREGKLNKGGRGRERTGKRH